MNEMIEASCLKTSTQTWTPNYTNTHAQPRSHAHIHTRAKCLSSWRMVLDVLKTLIVPTSDGSLRRFAANITYPWWIQWSWVVCTQTRPNTRHKSLLVGRKAKALPTNGRTNRRTNRWMDAHMTQNFWIEHLSSQILMKIHSNYYYIW